MLYPWATSIRKELAKTPKFYLFDNGVTRAIQGLAGVPMNSIEHGILFEQWVLQESYRITRYLNPDLKINFWKTSRGAEVDLIISRGSEIKLAIECKGTRFPSLRDTSGLKSFEEEYPAVPKFICAPTDERRVIGEKYAVIPPRELYEEIAAVVG